MGAQLVPPQISTTAVFEADVLLTRGRLCFNGAGASGLDKWARKQFESRALVKLNASVEKAPRMAAGLGKRKRTRDCSLGVGHSSSTAAALCGLLVGSLPAVEDTICPERLRCAA